MFAEIGQGVVQKLADDFAVEHVDAHRGQEEFAVAFNAQAGHTILPVKHSESCTAGSLGFSTKRVIRRSSSICMMPSDGSVAVAAPGMVAMVMSALRLDVLGDDVAEIHAVKLVAAQDQEVIEIVVQKMNQVLAHGIGGALIPRGVGKRLLGGEDLDEAAREMIELVGLRDVPVQRCRVELGQQINPAQSRS